MAEKEFALEAIEALNHATFDEEWLILDISLEDQLSKRISEVPEGGGEVAQDAQLQIDQEVK